MWVFKSVFSQSRDVRGCVCVFLSSVSSFLREGYPTRIHRELNSLMVMHEVKLNYLEVNAGSVVSSCVTFFLSLTSFSNTPELRWS